MKTVKLSALGIVIFLFFVTKFNSCAPGCSNRGTPPATPPTPVQVAPAPLPVETPGVENRNTPVVYPPFAGGPVASTPPAGTPPPTPAPATTPTPAIPTTPATPPHIPLKGLTFFGSETQGPFGLYPYDGVVRDWYSYTGEEEMGMIGIAGVVGVIVMCEGPVIYDMIITKDGKSTSLRIKKTTAVGDTGQTWDETTKTWSKVHPFRYTDIYNISGVRIMKDPDDITPIKVEIGYPRRVPVKK